MVLICTGSVLGKDGIILIMNKHRKHLEADSVFIMNKISPAIFINLIFSLKRTSGELT